MIYSIVYCYYSNSNNVSMWAYRGIVDHHPPTSTKLSIDRLVSVHREEELKIIFVGMCVCMVCVSMCEYLCAHISLQNKQEQQKQIRHK